MFDLLAQVNTLSEVFAGNPGSILAILAGLSGGGALGVVRALAYLSDIRQSFNRNQEAEEFLGSNVPRIEDAISSMDDATAGLPIVQSGGQFFGGTPSRDVDFTGKDNLLDGGASRPVVNFDELYDASQAGLDFLRGTDFSTYRTDLNLPELTEGGMFSNIREQGILPETDLSGVLGARLAGMGEASRIREQGRQEEISALAPSYGGLENLRGAQDLASFQEETARGTLAAQERGSIDLQEQAAKEFQSELASRLLSSETLTNASIREMNMNRRLGMFGTEAGLVQGAEQEDLLAALQAMDTAYKNAGIESGLDQAQIAAMLNLFAQQGGFYGFQDLSNMSGYNFLFGPEYQQPSDEMGLGFG